MWVIGLRCVVLGNWMWGGGGRWIDNNSAKNCNLLSPRLTNYPHLSFVALLHQIPASLTNPHTIVLTNNLTKEVVLNFQKYEKPDSFDCSCSPSDGINLRWVEDQETSHLQTYGGTLKKWINSPRIRKSIVSCWLGRYEELLCPKTRN